MSSRMRIWLALAAVALVVVIAVIVMGRIPRSEVAAVPSFSHVFVIVLENHAEEDIIGSNSAPYLNELANRYGIATAYSGLFHPSQPNYLALVSGSALGVEDDDNHDLDAPTLFDQLEAAGRDWRVAAENVPPNCYTGAVADDGPDGPGTYARKHNPAISFVGIQSSAARCAKIVPLSAFDPAAADVQLIVPNLCHDMHDCSIAEGDRWLSSWVPSLLASDAWKDDGVLFITFDEPRDKDAGARIATLVISPLVAAGSRSDEPHTHYSLLRTIEEAFDLDCLQDACHANTLGEFFPPSPEQSAGFSP